MTAQHFDVLIVGAGLSGVGAAYRLQTERPGTTYAILEGRDAMGGTWDLFRYPGIRSDSDMFTLGYPFRPWKDAKSIADGGSIRTYIEETAAEFGIDRHIRYRRRVVEASWSSADARWSVEVEVRGGDEDGHGEAAATERYTCSFLYLCSGYYSYEGGHTPDFPGVERFQGRLVHPQQWPADLDYTGQRVVVIGSGATAVTLVPAMAEQAAHVTMLQRSPSYISALPDRDAVADKLREALPERAAHRAVRWKNVLMSTALYQYCRRRPEAAKRMLLSAVAQHLGDQAAVDEHFTPQYQPWDQRLCLVPNADLFTTINSGRASVVTDRIAEFTERGIRLESGRDLEADVIVTATGLKLQMCGGIRLSVDGTAVDPGQAYVYRGCMLSGVPNLALCIGYTNASWTLRADLTSRYVCRLLTYMERNGLAVAMPRFDEPYDGGPILGLTSGYVARAADVLPKQGPRAPWLLRQNYVLDRASTTFGDVTRDMVFARARPVAAAPASRDELAARRAAAVPDGSVGTAA